MKPAIKRSGEQDEYFTAEGCFILELSNDVDDPGLSIARARVAPGVTTRWHRVRDTAERYLILEGRGRVELEGMAPQDVTADDVVLIPPGWAQRITNVGLQDLVFLAICTPRFAAHAYEDVFST